VGLAVEGLDFWEDFFPICISPSKTAPSRIDTLGVTILPPDVNRSQRKWQGFDSRIRVGLQSVRGLSDSLIKRMCEIREKNGVYSSPADFFFRTSPHEDEARQLIHAGALDSLQPRPNRTEQLWGLASYRRIEASVKSSPLFGVSLPHAPTLPPPSDKEKLRREYIALGFLCSSHPVMLFRHYASSCVSSKILKHYRGRRVRFLGWLLTGKLVSTKTGEAMEFLTFEDEHGVVETTFFPKIYRKYAAVLSSGKPYLLSGLVEEDFGAITLTVEKLETLDKV